MYAKSLLLLIAAASLTGYEAHAAQTSAKTPKTASDSAKAPADPGWPREVEKNGAKLIYYQPQIDEWKSYRQLKARIAFVLTLKDGNPVAGVADLEGNTVANLETRTVLIRDLKIAAARFPSLPDAEATAMETKFQQAFPSHSITVSLDRLVAGVERSKDAVKPVELKMDPPPIYMSDSPAILLLVEGEPVKAPIEGTKLEFVVNTNWDLFFEPTSSAYYVLTDKVWLTTTALDGKWTLASKLPGDFGKLPKGDNWDHVKSAVPARVAKGMVVPKVFYSEQPAELISFQSNPVWETVEGTHLLWGKNTDNWVFQDTENHLIYFLVSGRWFSASKFEGPWTYAGNDLPEDFKLIPPDSGCSDALASVPGTPEADDAVLLAQIPVEAVVKRKEAEAQAKVSYNGEPQFKAIEGTKMTYATNTSSDVIQVKNDYYLCQNAVWFVAGAPVGPWAVCAAVPEVIYSIPPAYPVHRVVYVHVASGATDDVVVCSYTGGYYGAFVAGAAAGAALVWGTGYYYPPFVAVGAGVPLFRPWPATYGVAAAYNPWTGGYAVGARAYGPYASAGRAAWYNPSTGTYGRAAHVEGPYGGRTVAGAYNPRTDTGFATRQGNNGYAQWGTSVARRGDDWARAGHVTTENGGVAAWRGSEGGGRAWSTANHSGGAAVHDGNFYAGHDGNVYRRDDNGDWSKYNDHNWESVDHQDAKNNAQNRLNERRDNPGSAGPNNGRRENPGNAEPGRGEDRKPGENGTRPGAGGAGTRDERGDRKRGEPGGGQQKIGQGGEERKTPVAQRPERQPLEKRTPIGRAQTQPSNDVMSGLDRESRSRGRGEFQAQRQQTFQRSGGGASFTSRSFHGGGGGGGFHGGRRR